MCLGRVSYNDYENIWLRTGSSVEAALQNLGQANFSWIVLQSTASHSLVCDLEMRSASIRCYTDWLKLWQMFQLWLMFQLWQAHGGITVLVLPFTFHFKLCKVVLTRYLKLQWLISILKLNRKMLYKKKKKHLCKHVREFWQIKHFIKAYQHYRTSEILRSRIFFT